MTGLCQREGDVATTKREIVRRVSLRTHQKQHVARKVVQAFLDELLSELGQGHRLEFREFGVFDLLRKKPRLARNPRTGAVVHVPAKLVVQFKAGRLMKAKVRELEKRLGVSAPAESPASPKPA
jgi:integration host factor subunit beta